MKLLADLAKLFKEEEKQVVGLPVSLGVAICSISDASVVLFFLMLFQIVKNFPVFFFCAMPGKDE